MENNTANEEVINMLTLQCLTNNDKFKSSKTYVDMDKAHRKQWRKEVKFYKHRILDETKKFLKNSKEGANEDDIMKEAFRIYALKLITYFKMQDTVETMQDHYEGLSGLEGILEDELDEVENKEEILEKANNLMSNIKKIPVTLDSFVIKSKINKNKEHDNIPKKKEIDLKDQKFKKKGIRKKKQLEENITSN